MFCLNDNFYDIVFGITINYATYDFEKEEFIKKIDKIKKNMFHFGYIFFNGFILLCLVYILLFILIPIIIYRIKQQTSHKRVRVTEFKEKIGSNNISLLKERLTSTTNIS